MGSVLGLACSFGRNGKAWSACTMHLNSFSKAGSTLPFMISPHLPPQVVILSVAAWARSTAGAAIMAPVAAPASSTWRRVGREFRMALSIERQHLKLQVGAQPDDPFEQDHHAQRQHDRDHRSGGYGPIEIKLHIVEQHDRERLTFRHDE